MEQFVSLHCAKLCNFCLPYITIERSNSSEYCNWCMRLTLSNFSCNIRDGPDISSSNLFADALTLLLSPPFACFLFLPFAHWSNTICVSLLLKAEFLRDNHPWANTGKYILQHHDAPWCRCRNVKWIITLMTIDRWGHIVPANARDCH